MKTLFSISLKNWSNLKRTFTGSHGHILPSLCTYAVGTRCLLIRISELFKVSLCSCIRSYSFFPTQRHSSSNLFLLKCYSSPSFCTESLQSACNPTMISPLYNKAMIRLLYSQLQQNSLKDLSLPSRVHFYSSHSLLNPLKPCFHPHHSVETALVKVTDEHHAGLPQLLTQPGVCHLLCLWDLSPNFLFVKYSAYHKWKEGDFTHVLPNFDNASYPAPLFHTIKKIFFLVNLFFLLGSRGWDGEYLCIYNKNLWNN